MNNKKMTLITIVGALLLVVAIAGVSFAFFVYSRTGSTNNQITAGKLLVRYEENNNNLNITDAYPMADTAGVQSGQFTFTVSGYITGSEVVNYTVYAVLGNTESGRTRLRDYEVKMHLTGSIANGTSSSTINIRNNYNSTYGSIVGAAGSVQATDTLVLATGTISSHNASSQEVHTYSLQLWIPESVVSIGGETSTTNGTTTTYTSTDFESLYYSLKINVRANA